MNPRSDDILARLRGAVHCEVDTGARMLGEAQPDQRVSGTHEWYATVSMDPIFRCETCGIAYTVREGYSLKNEPRTQTRCAHHPFDCFYLNAAGKWKCPADGCANNCIECGRLQAEFERLRWEHQLTRARLNAADLSDPGL